MRAPILIAVLLLFAHAAHAGESGLPYATFLADVDAKAVRTVMFDGDVMHAAYADGRKHSFRPQPSQIQPVMDRLRANGVEILVRPAKLPGAGVPEFILNWFPLALLVSPAFAALAVALWYAVRRK